MCVCVLEGGVWVIIAFSGNTFTKKVYLMCLEADVIKASFTLNSTRSLLIPVEGYNTKQICAFASQQFHTII